MAAVVTTHIVDREGSVNPDSLDLFADTAEFVRGPVSTGVDFSDRVIAAAQQQLAEAPLLILKTYATDFREALAEARALLDRNSLEKCTLVFNTLPFSVERGVSNEAVIEQFKLAVGHSGSEPQQMFHVDFLFTDNKPEHVNTMANILAYVKLTGVRALVVGPVMERWINPDSSLRRGISDCGEYNMGPVPSAGKNSGAPTVEPTPVLGFTIAAVVPDMLGDGFTMRLRTNLGREELFENLRLKFFAVPFEAITRIDGGFEVQYPDYGSSSVRNFVNLVHAMSVSGKQSPLADAERLVLYAGFEKLRADQFKLVTVARYYQKVDERDGQWIVDLFVDENEGPGIKPIYERGEDTIIGRKGLVDFYVGDPERSVPPGRQIHGIHTIERCELLSDGAVLVKGKFDGHGAKGNEIHVSFTDYWTFDPNGKVRVSTRTTHLGTGATVVRS